MDRPDIDGERGGLARPRVLEDGPVLERAAVNFSHTAGARVPETTAARQPGGEAPRRVPAVARLADGERLSPRRQCLPADSVIPCA
ncbi:MAG: coproporphyrinogen III oxidase [bacterium]|nr:coproporphyrinogen III oxidase [bacterium]